MPGKGTAKEYRRLDTLARLLEESGPCASVCIYKDQVLIATNSIHASSRGRFVGSESVEYQRLDKTLKYFARVARAEADESDDGAAILTGICTQSLKVKDISTTTLTDAEISTVMGRILLTDSKLKSRADIKTAISEETKSAFKTGGAKGRQMLSVIAMIEERSRDFHKLKRDLKDERVTLPLRAALASTGEKAYKILKEGADGLHAEMRIIDHILSDEAAFTTSPIYVGISKLCCKNCHAAVKAVNVIKGDAIREDRAKDEAAALAAAEAASPTLHAAVSVVRVEGEHEQSKTPVAVLFETRGNHDLSFPGRWPVPRFLLTHEYNTQYIESLKHIEAPEDKVAQAASRSDSPSATAGTGTPPDFKGVRPLLGGVTDDALISELEKRFPAKIAEIAAFRAELGIESVEHHAGETPEGERAAKRARSDSSATPGRAVGAVALLDDGMETDALQAAAEAGSVLVGAGAEHVDMEMREEKSLVPEQSIVDSKDVALGGKEGRGRKRKER